MGRRRGVGAESELANRLQAIHGVRALVDEPLARHTTFRIGGPADLFLEIGGIRSLRRVVALLNQQQVQIHLLGLGSNLLVPDAGLDGAVLRLTGHLTHYRIWDSKVTAGAGLSLAQLARFTAERGLVGMEALTGFPSTVGGAVWMNAGCYGTEIRDVFVAATVVDRTGGKRRIGLEELGPSYRATRLQGTGAIVAAATFQLRKGNAAAAMARVAELNAKRRATSPPGRTAGSIFKNPPGDYAGRLVEACGLKGRAVGGARISRQHANVIVNEAGARAADVLALMQLAYGEVRARFGVRLQPEVVLAGSLARDWRQIEESSQSSPLPEHHV